MHALWFDQTGLPWVNPSPNLRSHAALMSYPGAVYFEGSTLTEGRGTDRPFEQIGASWLNAPEVARMMNERQLPGIRFEAITMPVAQTASKFAGQTIPGIRFAVTDRQAYRPVRTSLLLIDEIRRQHRRDFAWTGGDDRSPHGLGQGAARHRGGAARSAAGGVGPGSYDIAGEELRAIESGVSDDELATLALEIEAIIEQLKIVGWAQNTDVQNRMRTAIEDELFDFQERRGVTLPYDALDRIMDQCIDVARRRSARP